MSGESASAIHRSQVDLVDFVDWSGVECLNQSTSHSVVNALKQGYREDDGLNLESDADEQLLIYIPFTQVIKLHSILIKGTEEEGPKTVKLYSNKEHMGFSNVSDFPPSDTAVLSPDNIKGNPVPLKYVKFQNVRSLTIFIEDNQSDAEITKVQKIALFGTTCGFCHVLEGVGGDSDHRVFVGACQLCAPCTRRIRWVLVDRLGCMRMPHVFLVPVGCVLHAQGA
uniref:PITH domain-containing protein n=1 Tax=Fagus sylvatica TaxID=28930 RepID=A0A2N9HKI0_FAGSY